MIKDAHLLLSEGQLATDATGASDNIIDLTKAGDAVAGAELYLVVRVGTAISSSGKGATLAIAVQTDTVDTFNDVLATLATLSLAEALLTADTIIWKLKLPPGLKRFLRLYYTESGEAFTAGTIDAFLTPDVNIA